MLIGSGSRSSGGMLWSMTSVSEMTSSKSRTLSQVRVVCEKDLDLSLFLIESGECGIFVIFFSEMSYVALDFSSWNNVRLVV